MPRNIFQPSESIRLNQLGATDMWRMSAAVLAAALTALSASIVATAAELPMEIQQRSTLQVALSNTYAPMEYRDPADNQLKGLDVDIVKEIAKRLKLTIVWSEVPFAQLVPSLQTKRADLIISGMSDRSSRRETVDFVDYLVTGPQFFVLATGPINSPTDACGKKVGTTRSSGFPGDIENWSKANCESSGKPPVQYTPGENAIDVRAQLKQGRIDAAVQGSETLPYALAQEPGAYRIVGEPFATGYQGIMFRKDDVQFRQAVMEAIEAMIHDDAYKAILDKYGLGSHAVSRPLLNASNQ
jgi:polar amino acid transport system substrate-binding protein